MEVPQWGEVTNAPSGDRLWIPRQNPHLPMMHAFPPWGQEGLDKAITREENRDFPGSPVVKTPRSQCRGMGLILRVGRKNA